MTLTPVAMVLTTTRFVAAEIRILNLQQAERTLYLTVPPPMHPQFARRARNSLYRSITTVK